MPRGLYIAGRNFDIDANIVNQTGVFSSAGGTSENVVAIPEPAALGLFAFALIGLRRRRQPR